MRVIFTPAARAELIEAEDWYELQQSTLGSRFRQEIEAVVGRMTQNPFQFPIVFQDVQRARLNKFPYSLFFRAETDDLIVIACFHASRDPVRWQLRV